MEIKLCRKCNLHGVITNRLICKKCKSEQSRKHYYTKGQNNRYNRKVECVACGTLFIQWRKKQVICPNCRKQSMVTKSVPNQYIKVGARDEHRVIAEEVLKRKLSYNEVVHHVDENPKNNSLENLWVMSRHNHGKLHCFLRLQKVIYEKSLDCNSVNCWNNLRVIQTTAWLEMASAKVIKLNELVDQQPSPFNMGKVQRLDTEHLNEQDEGEGIVQEA